MTEKIKSDPEPDRRRGELGGPRRPGPGQPAWKTWLWRADWVWRRMVPLMALVLACYAIFGLQNKVDQNASQLDAQREGRQVAQEIICGGISGVEDAGQRILEGTLPPPAPTPSSTPTAVEEQLRDLYAQAYARVISERVIAQAGAKAKGILRPDGTIDCQALKRESSAVPTPTPTPDDG